MKNKLFLLLVVFFTAAFATATTIAAGCCIAPDNGTGTVEIPSSGCPYDHQEKMLIIDGLPPGTTIEIAGPVQEFSNVVSQPGGSLGGEQTNFNAVLVMDMMGTGQLTGFTRHIQMPLTCEMHTGPRVPGQPVQSFDTDMFRVQGQLPPGDPDFDLLRITAGTGFGMPSPGHTTLTRLPGGNWAVDSFFDITYRIDFVGKPGRPLGGMSGSTTATIRMSTCTTQAAGENCWEVACGDAIADFTQDPIPADFFDPGSEPFDGAVWLGGGNQSGPDTVVRRLDALVFSLPLPSTDTVPIELVQLHLVSCEPIVVKYPDGSTTQWMLEVGLSQVPAPLGHVTVLKTHANGGTFTAQLPVQPVFIFTKVGEPWETRILDTGMLAQPPIILQTTEPYPWQDTSPKTNPPCDGNGFYPVGEELMVMRSPGDQRLLLSLQPPMPPSPYFALDTAEQWQGALDQLRVRPVPASDWNAYMQQWRTHLQEGEPYPPNTFWPAELYVWPGTQCICPNDPSPNDPGLVMVWGDPAVSEGSHSSAWTYAYPDDPDLSSATITITVKPPCGMNVVSFGMQDINGNIRAWYWNVAAAPGPGTLQCGVPTPVSVNGALTGVGAATPAAAGYMNNPGFDITKVQNFIVDENYNWVGGATPVPPPGQPIPRMWNYWYDVIVTPNPQVKPKDPVKWSQPPVQCGPRIFLGWDERSMRNKPPLMADDWLCIDKRPVTDIHWWGSFLKWAKPDKPPQKPVAFHIAIWTDVPKDPNDYKSFSHPGRLVWEHICTQYQMQFVGYDKDPRKHLGTTDPTGAVLQPAVHDSCFQFYCKLPQSEWFYQEPGPCGRNIYWLSIAAIYAQTAAEPLYPWGWKTRPHFFNDDAVRIWSILPNPTGLNWPPQIGSAWAHGEPVEYPRCISWDLAFELTTNRDCPPAPLEADFDVNGIVNFLDFAFFAGQWLSIWP